MKRRFEELYRQYRDTVYGYLYYMCREEELLRKEEGQMVRDVLALLKEERTLLLLKDYEELSCEEIARMMDLTEGNVKVKLHRIRQKYRKLYLREMEGLKEKSDGRRI